MACLTPSARLLRRTLAKDVRQRLQHIGDARLELEEIGNDTNEPSAAGRRRSRAVPVLLGAAALIAIAAGLASWLGGQRLTGAHGERRRPSVAEDRGRDGQQSSTFGEQVLRAVRPLTRRHAARLSRTRQRTLATLFARAVRIRNQTHSWYRGGNDAVLLTRRPVDRLLASGGSYPPQSLAVRRFSDRNCSDRITARCALDIERRDCDRRVPSGRRTVVDPRQRRHAQNHRRPRPRRRRIHFTASASTRGATTFSSQALVPTEPGSMCCRVKRERDDACCAAAGTDQRVTQGRAISCTRTAIRSWRSL